MDRGDAYDSDFEEQTEQTGEGGSKRVVRRWTQEEHNKLVELVARQQASGSTEICWANIAKEFPDRTGKQCRHRWVNSCQPYHKRGTWDLDEEEVVAALHAVHGSAWSHIASNLKGRSENSVKNHFNALYRSKYLDSKKDSVLANYVKLLREGSAQSQETYELALAATQAHKESQAALALRRAAAREAAAAAATVAAAQAVAMPRPSLSVSAGAAGTASAGGSQSMASTRGVGSIASLPAALPVQRVLQQQHAAATAAARSDSPAAERSSSQVRLKDLPPLTDAGNGPSDYRWLFEDGSGVSNGYQQFPGLQAPLAGLLGGHQPASQPPAGVLGAGPDQASRWVPQNMLHGLGMSAGAQGGAGEMQTPLSAAAGDATTSGAPRRRRSTMLHQMSALHLSSAGSGVDTATLAAYEAAARSGSSCGNAAQPPPPAHMLSMLQAMQPPAPHQAQPDRLSRSERHSVDGRLSYTGAPAAAPFDPMLLDADAFIRKVLGSAEPSEPGSAPACVEARDSTSFSMCGASPRSGSGLRGARGSDQDGAAGSSLGGGPAAPRAPAGAGRPHVGRRRSYAEAYDVADADHYALDTALLAASVGAGQAAGGPGSGPAYTHAANADIGAGLFSSVSGARPAEVDCFLMARAHSDDTFEGVGSQCLRGTPAALMSTDGMPNSLERGSQGPSSVPLLLATSTPTISGGASGSAVAQPAISGGAAQSDGGAGGQVWGRARDAVFLPSGWAPAPTVDALEEDSLALMLDQIEPAPAPTAPRAPRTQRGPLITVRRLSGTAPFSRTNSSSALRYDLGLPPDGPPLQPVPQPLHSAAQRRRHSVAVTAAEAADAFMPELADFLPGSVRRSSMSLFARGGGGGRSASPLPSASGGSFTPGARRTAASRMRRRSTDATFCRYPPIGGPSTPFIQHHSQGLVQGLDPHRGAHSGPLATLRLLQQDPGERYLGGPTELLTGAGGSAPFISTPAYTLAPAAGSIGGVPPRSPQLSGAGPSSGAGPGQIDLGAAGLPVTLTDNPAWAKHSAAARASDVHDPLQLPLSWGDGVTREATGVPGGAASVGDRPQSAADPSSQGPVGVPILSEGPSFRKLLEADLMAESPPNGINLLDLLPECDNHDTHTGLRKADPLPADADAAPDAGGAALLHDAGLDVLGGEGGLTQQGGGPPAGRIAIASSMSLNSILAAQATDLALFPSGGLADPPTDWLH